MVNIYTLLVYSYFKLVFLRYSIDTSTVVRKADNNSYYTSFEFIYSFTITDLDLLPSLDGLLLFF